MTLHFSEISGPPQTGQTASIFGVPASSVEGGDEFADGTASDIESELDHVAVFDDVFFSLDAELADFARLGL